MSSPRIAASIEELVAGASRRQPVRSSDAKSGASFERLEIDGEGCFLKVLSSEDDWIMRVTGNTSNWEYLVWRAGVYHDAPPVIDHAIVAMALEAGRLAILMTDRSADLVPPGDDLLTTEQHDRFVEHLAAFHARFLGWRDTIGLQDLGRRFLFFAPEIIAPELARPDVPGPISAAAEGWRRLPERSPRLADLVRRVHADPEALAAAMA